MKDMNSKFDKFDKTWVGMVMGLILPLIIMFFIFIFAEGEPNMKAWLLRIKMANIITHIVTLSVFANIIIFLLFNKLDLLKATKGVLAITIVWALVVFGIKFLS